MSDQTSNPDAPATAALTYQDRLRRHAQPLLNPPARLLARLRFTPNVLTSIGFLLNLVVAILLATGRFVLGGGLLLVAACFDALDGTLARMTGQQSRFGAFFDSTVDRYSEATVYGGLLYYYLQHDAPDTAIVLYAAIIGSQMVSYARARAEGLGIDCKVGLATRVERTLIFAGGLIVNRPEWALWLVAILANLTAVQRILHVRKAAGSSGNR